jgi:hypothetical protein
MLDGDLSDSPLASHRPSIEEQADTFRDFLRETFARFNGNLPISLQAFRALCFQLIDEAIREAGASTPAEVKSMDSYDQAVRLLRLISRSDEGGLGMRAACFLRLLGVDGRSFQEIADAYGFDSRAAPHAAYRKIQRATGLRARGDKSDDAREHCRNRRTGQLRARQPWAGLSAWNKARLAAAAA